MKILAYPIILFLVIGCKSPDKTETTTSKDVLSNKEIGLLKNDEFGENDSLFLNMITSEIITVEEDKKYISNIAQLKSVKLINCDSMNIHYKDIIEGKQIEFKLSLKEFKKENHKIKYKVHSINGYQDCEAIDGKEPWGGYYGHPKTEIDKLEVSINGKKIQMKEKFQDVFNFQMCDSDYRKYFNPNPLLKYDIENEVYYLYIKGGNAADNYFGKFVFNENQFINRYLLHYGQLSETGSFRINFKGF